MKINIAWSTNAELELLEIMETFIGSIFSFSFIRDYNLSMSQLFANDSILLLNIIPLAQTNYYC